MRYSCIAISIAVVLGVISMRANDLLVGQHGLLVLLRHGRCRCRSAFGRRYDVGKLHQKLDAPEVALDGAVDELAGDQGAL